MQCGRVRKITTTMSVRSGDTNFLKEMGRDVTKKEGGHPLIAWKNNGSDLNRATVRVMRTVMFYAAS